MMLKRIGPFPLAPFLFEDNNAYFGAFVLGVVRGSTFGFCF